MPTTDTCSGPDGVKPPVGSLSVGGVILHRLLGVGRLFRFGRGVALLSIMVAMLIGATAGSLIWHDRQSAFEEHRQSMESMGIVLAEQTSRQVQVIDLMLQDVQSQIAKLNLSTPIEFRDKLSNNEVHSSLVKRLEHVPQVDALALIDAGGLILNWSRPWSVEAKNVSRRDYFQYLLGHNDPQMFVTSLLESSGTGVPALVFARRVNAPDGTFLGIILATVEIKFLGEFYQAAGKRIKQAVTLVRRDGTMLLRYPHPETAIGVKLPYGSPWYVLSPKGGGSYITPGTLDGMSALVVVRPLAEYPLVLDIVMHEADLLAKWREETWYTALCAVVGALAFTGLFWLLGRQFRRQAEQNATLDAVLGNMTQAICFFDGDKRLQLSNRRYSEIFNLPPEATKVGRSLKELISYREIAGTAVEMSQSDYRNWGNDLTLADRPADAVTTLRNGRIVSAHYQSMPNGGWMATHEDVTERHQADAKIMFMARHDALTKLANRALFQERMEQAIATVGRGGQFALFCLDLDKFKQVNDTLGHPAGDALLVAVAERLQACVRKIDTVARLGGDEFAIIQLALRQPDDAEVLASRIIAAFAQPFDLDGHQIMAGISIGVALAPGDGASYEALMRDADIALYLAKTEGRGTARFFEPEMDARIHIRRVLEQDLQGAITRNEFELYYQPQINLISNRVFGFEALLRWRHPDRGFISPADFIPVAEETGMIVAIGEWVLRTACLEAQNWPTGVSVAVNLSPVQFKKGDIVKTIQAALEVSGLQSDRLEVEITETVVLHETPDNLKILHQLRALGISIALDDFGTGYSSLSYLHSFPFSKIKIDQSFVRDLMTSKRSMSIVRAVVGLGESLGMMTLAEGVETKEQLHKLRDKGCTEVQGYFFSRPKPASEVPAMIEGVQANILTSKREHCQASSG